MKNHASSGVIQGHAQFHSHKVVIANVIWKCLTKLIHVSTTDIYTVSCIDQVIGKVKVCWQMYGDKQMYRPTIIRSKRAVNGCVVDLHYLAPRYFQNQAPGLKLCVIWADRQEKIMSRMPLLFVCLSNCRSTRQEGMVKHRWDRQSNRWSKWLGDANGFYILQIPPIRLKLVMWKLQYLLGMYKTEYKVIKDCRNHLWTVMIVKQHILELQC